MGFARPILVAILAAAFVQAAPKALLIDGAAQTETFKAILETNRLFDVEVVTPPNKDSAPSAFRPQFDKYKVVVLNYGGDAWPLTALASLEKYVQNGGGLVVLPAADSAFPVWPDYGLMIGLSSAGNRSQSAGPFWFYRAGNVEYDSATPGPAGKVVHPDQQFLVTIRDTEHPVTKGLPLTWMHATDELKGALRGPGKNMVVLATAFSPADRGGTGRDEPQIIALTYGKGRVFHTLLGSTPEALQCVGLQTLIERGAEWAATGKVTQRVPPDFPSEDKVSVRAFKGGAK